MVGFKPRSVAADFPSFPFEGDRLIRLAVTQTFSPSLEIVAEIASQKSEGSEFLPLTDMNEFVTNQSGESRGISG